MHIFYELLEILLKYLIFEELCFGRNKNGELVYINSIFVKITKAYNFVWISYTLRSNKLWICLRVYYFQNLDIKNWS